MIARLLMSLLLVGTLVACSSSAPGARLGETCSTTQACDPGLRCVGNLCPTKAIGISFCVAEGACTPTSCNAGETCVALEGTTDTLCVADDICPSKHAAGLPCAADRECETGTCLALYCDGATEPPSVCISGACQNGTCAEGDTMWGDPADDASCWCAPESACPAPQE